MISRVHNIFEGPWRTSHERSPSCDLRRQTGVLPRRMAGMMVSSSGGVLLRQWTLPMHSSTVKQLMPALFVTPLTVSLTPDGVSPLNMVVFWLSRGASGIIVSLHFIRHATS
jgi:hypothetical protein